jgi:hypothetical protein
MPERKEEERVGTSKDISSEESADLLCELQMMQRLASFGASGSMKKAEWQ